MEQKFYTYIIKGLNEFFYCGITNNIHRRYNEHNTGQSKSTIKNLPYALKFLRQFNTRKEARKLEVKIKTTGVYKWYCKNIIFGNYPNMVITHLISGHKEYDYMQGRK